MQIYTYFIYFIIYTQIYIYIYIYIYIIQYIHIYYIYTLCIYIYTILICTNASFQYVISKHIQKKYNLFKITAFPLLYRSFISVKDKPLIDIYKASEKKVNICEFICLLTMYKHIYLYIEREREREREGGAYPPPRYLTTSLYPFCCNLCSMVTFFQYMFSFLFLLFPFKSFKTHFLDYVFELKFFIIKVFL